jgi:hypothetical protein
VVCVTVRLSNIYARGIRINHMNYMDRISCTSVPHYYVLMRAGYVLHSLEYLERGVVGKCCSNVLRSLRAYGVVPTHVCVSRKIQRTCVAHDARSHTHNRVRGHINPCIRACRHTQYKHACMPCTYTYLHSSAQRNCIYYAHTCTHASRLCTALT